MTYEDLFYHKPEAEIRHHTYIKKPDTIDSTKSLEYYADNARRAIKEAEELIAFLKEYQKDLCTRYQEIVSTNYTLFLLLKRFEELKKQYPNIENAMEIEKHRWER